MGEQVKVSVIGGGSPFVMQFLHGLMTQAERWQGARREILLSLCDLQPEYAQRWARLRSTGAPPGDRVAETVRHFPAACRVARCP